MAHRFGRACVRALEIVIVACLALMAVLVFGNVVLRYAFDSGIAVSEELSRLLTISHRPADIARATVRLLSAAAANSADGSM